VRAETGLILSPLRCLYRLFQLEPQLIANGLTAEVDSSETVSRLKLLSSHDEAGNVRTFVFETGGLEWIAGQSQGYVLPQVGEKEEDNQRWFTIASAPSEGEIHISTRVTDSKFKQALNAMKAGEHIHAYGLEGNFTWEEEPSDPVVFVAAGIGITPFRSILFMRDVSGKRLNSTLLYFNRTMDVPFLTELKALDIKHSEFSMILVVGEQISADAIIKLAPQARMQTVFLSGPEPMVEAIGSELRDRGIAIKQDWFPGYDEKSY